jgi:hypothetical protein
MQPSGSGSGHLHDDGAAGGRGRYRLPVLPHRFDVKADRFPDQLLDLVPAGGGRDAPRKIGDVRGPAVTTRPRSPPGTRSPSSPSRDPGLFPDRSQSTGLELTGQIARHGHRPRSFGVTKLRWEPLCRTMCQPSHSRMRTTSRTFTPIPALSSTPVGRGAGPP